MISTTNGISKSVIVTVSVVLCLILVAVVSALVAFVQKRKDKINKENSVELLRYQTQENDGFIKS